MYGSSVLVWKAAVQLHCDSSRCLGPLGNLLRKPLQILRLGEAPVSLETAEACLCFKSVVSQMPWKLACGKAGQVDDKTITHECVCTSVHTGDTWF